jgi:pyocin large subunit-like protein
LLNAKASGNIKEFVSGDGWLFKYNSATNEFVLLSDKGTISTFFKPVGGLTYWLEQISKYKR